MKKRGLSLIEVVVTCSLLVIYINGMYKLSSFYNQAKIRLDSNTIAMYSLESIRNIILKDLGNGKKLSEINEDSYREVLSKFPYPVKFELDHSEKNNVKILAIVMKCPVTLNRKRKKVYYREIVINE